MKLEKSIYIISENYYYLNIKTKMRCVRNMKNGKIKHMVLFCLKHDKKSLKEKKFLQDSKSILSNIEGVKNFKVFKQIHPKNDYDFCFSMEFDDEIAYEKYIKSSAHVDFVRKRWIKEVESFFDIDLQTQ